MIPACENLYQDMQADIGRSLALDYPEKDNVESGYWIARNYWNQLKGMVNEAGFGSACAEIVFYKEVKPAFACYIDYFSLLSEGLLFEPNPAPFPGDLEGRMTQDDWVRGWQVTIRDYWKAEGVRGERFYKKHQAFLDYCASGNTGEDAQYFLVQQCSRGDMTQRRSHNRGTELYTVHEEILTTWKAFTMYGAYIQKKLFEKLASS